MGQLNSISKTMGRPSETGFCAWLGLAYPNEVLIYHRGVLALDTSPLLQTGQAQDRQELCRVARRARWAAVQGLVHLLQRRNGPDDFTYFAVARQRPAKPTRATMFPEPTGAA